MDFHGASIVQSNVLSAGANVIIQQDSLDWTAVLNDIEKLRGQTSSKAMLAFAGEAEQAARQSNWEKFKAAARKLGEHGIEYLRDASIIVLAELASKALGI